MQNTLKNLHTSQENFKPQTCTRYDITKDYNLQPTMCKNNNYSYINFQQSCIHLYYDLVSIIGQFEIGVQKGKVPLMKKPWTNMHITNVQMPCQSILNLSLYKSQGEKGYIIFHIANDLEYATLASFMNSEKWTINKLFMASWRSG